MTRLSARRLNPRTTAFSVIWESCGHKPLQKAIKVHAVKCASCGNWQDRVRETNGKLTCPECGAECEESDVSIE